MHVNSRFAILSAIVVLSSPLRAQNNASATAGSDTTRVLLHVAPTVTDSAPPRAATPAVDLRAAAHYSRATQPAAPMRFAPPSQTQPVALMIVGGAALLAGALIEGDAGRVFMVGGAVIGLIGLYQYLQ
jgi:hypothetical protein